MTFARLLGLAVLLSAPAPDDVKDPGPAAESPVFVATMEVHGRVVLNNYSTQAGVPAVQFDHGRHRVMFRCRVCHAELAFALKAGETRVSAETNGNGLHCGACHDGKTTYAGRPIFKACTGWRKLDPARGCSRCHSGSSRAPLDGRYEALLRTLPRDVADYVDWSAAERRDLIKPGDFLEGVTNQRPAMKLDRDLTIDVKGTWLGRVTFSHKKHTAWTGCELCHPEIFPVTKRGSATYTMAAIFNGEFCGACHNAVAFPVSVCERCHGKSTMRR